jgi:hypothetical protein
MNSTNLASACASIAGASTTCAAIVMTASLCFGACAADALPGAADPIAGRVRSVEPRLTNVIARTRGTRRDRCSYQVVPPYNLDLNDDTIDK